MFFAMKHTTDTGNDLIRASLMAAVRCCPSTIHPGFDSSGTESSIGMISLPVFVKPP